MTMKRMCSVFVAGLVLGLLSVTGNAEQERSMLDGDLLAAEIMSVELVFNSSGEVVQVRLEDCAQCELPGYLPSRKLRFSYGGQSVSSSQVRSLNGNPGTVVINRETGMVEQVMFWRGRGAEAE
ncbi:hypothetical protein [Marinobacter sp. F4216]|uniref:hypothetical protein n=1 Tax=Marinobacter sp. F4216 TaxID=2874281 RepID=UPI001CBA8B26|nr:hypothetical protein [Marinobacter sp. F4216]MBZ2170102.1 hypothetical protein [Marinobacter sp. F4216]